MAVPASNILDAFVTQWKALHGDTLFPTQGECEGALEGWKRANISGYAELSKVGLMELANFTDDADTWIEEKFPEE